MAKKLNKFTQILDIPRELDKRQTKVTIISFDEESDSIIWDTVPNVHHYKIYIDGEVLGCDPERESAVCLF